MSNNSLATAARINLPNSTNLQFTGESVSASAPDFYTFTLKGRSSLNFTLNSLTTGGNVNFKLLASNGTTVLQDSTNTGNLADSINRFDQGAGVYYLQVYTDSTTNANYSLSLTSRNTTRFDIVWRNYGTPGISGLTSLWTMNGVTPTNTVNFPISPPPDWQIAGTGDFNQDGEADIVWRNYGATVPPGGRTVIWTMNGVTPTNTVPLNTPPVDDPNWRIEGVADFNNDGQADLVWRYYGTTGPEVGKTVIWTMNGTVPTSTLEMPVLVTDPNWQIVGVGDFTGDGLPDLVWRNYGPTVPPGGRTVIWGMNGVNPVSTIPLNTPPVDDPNWRIEAVGDFNGDNQTDIVWRNYGPTVPPGGRTVIWTMNGTVPTSTVTFPVAVDDTNWRVDALRARFDPPPRIDIDGNSLATAFKIGSLNGNGNYSDFVSGTDPSDYYHFSVTGTSTALQLTLDQLTGDANVEILNVNGTRIDSSEETGIDPESIQINNLAAGSYYIRVFSAGGSARYRLNLVTQTVDLQGKIGGFDIVPGTFNLPHPTNPNDPAPTPSAFNVNYQIQNTGLSTAGASTVQFYLSVDNIFDATDKLLGTQNVTSLAAGATQSGTISVVLPNADDSFWGTDGTYYIGMIIDPLNQVPGEVDETNNFNANPNAQPGVLFDTVGITGIRAYDLVGNTVSGPANISLTAGSTQVQSITINYTLKNVGTRQFPVTNGPSTASISFLLSTDNQIVFGADTFLSEESFNGATNLLTVGATSGTQTLTLNLTGSQFAASGTYYIGYIIDQPNVLGENSAGRLNNSNQGLNIDFFAINVTLV
jgi:hypothetical protein